MSQPSSDGNPPEEKSGPPIKLPIRTKDTQEAMESKEEPSGEKIRLASIPIQSPLPLTLP